MIIAGIIFRIYHFEINQYGRSKESYIIYFYINCFILV